MTLELKYNLSLTTGDPSDDGHGKTATTFYKSTHTPDEVIALHRKAAKKYKLDLRSECEDYENPRLTLDFYNTLLKIFGRDRLLTMIEDLNAEYAGKGPYVNYDAFETLYLEIAALADPTFKWEEVPSTVVDIDIGGYGLFY